MSFYTSLSGLKSAQVDLNVIAHNIANAETSGFKKSRVEFADVVVASAASAGGGVGIGAKVEAIDQDFGIGPVEQTGNALDLAIGGDGFFTAKSPTSGRTIHTRDGSFRHDTAGYLTDRDGNRMQMLTSGGTTPSDALVPRLNPASSPLTSVTVGRDGAITGFYADGTTSVVGNVALAQFVEPTGLKAVGSANWEATGRSGAPTYGSPGTNAFGDLQIGARERSNVDLSEELVSLITAQRYFQANAKAVDTSTQIAQTIINLQS